MDARIRQRDGAGAARIFHRYTVDEHTLVCIEKLDALLDTDERKFEDYKDLFQKTEDASVLYLALLLHDTGKAANSRHLGDTRNALELKPNQPILHRAQVG